MSEMREILRRKQAMRRRVAALPLVEKLRLLDILRERSLPIAACRARRQEQEPPTIE
jgi:hypothetical protein